jgi:nickel/cobalt transporter (NiCoT) family protein
MFPHIFDDAPERTRGKVVGLYAILVSANIAVWLWALAAFQGNAFLLGTAFLAYSFGLRHAFDADHIAAIDNITRKLMQEGRRPVAVGFFFSLGHATIVVALVLAIAPMTAAAQQHFAALKEIGGVVATAISAAFLFAIAAANIVVLAQICGVLRAVGKTGRMPAENHDHSLPQSGPIARLLRPLFALIGRSWHAYPLGLLFELGFDTATEVGLLGLSAGQAAHGLSIWSILIFPALFTAGMSLMDTADSTIMVGTYGWGIRQPDPQAALQCDCHVRVHRRRARHRQHRSALADRRQVCAARTAVALGRPAQRKSRLDRLFACCVFRRLLAGVFSSVQARQLRRGPDFRGTARPISLKIRRAK